MKKIITYACCLAVMLLSGSCIHQYPEENHTLVNLTLDVEIDSSLPVYQEVTRTPGLIQRFIVDVYQDGKVIAEKRIQTARVGEISEGIYSIPVSLTLDAREYTLAVWSDYVETEECGDLHFHTQDLAHIVLAEEYHPACNQREAFCGTATADLTPYAGEKQAEASLHIHLKRPQAKFRIVGTDAGDFLTRAKTRGGTSGEYRAKVSYEYYFPTGYNVTRNLLCESRVGISFTAPCSIEEDENGECELASDFVLAGADASHVSLTLEILNGKNSVLSRVTGLQVPVKQGHLTIVKGDFLTTLMKPGISIDPGYDGEYNIIIK